MKVCAICATTSAAKGTVFDVSVDMMQNFLPRATQITPGELLGIMASFKFFAEALHQVECIAFSDNMAAIHTAINGASSALDLTWMAHEPAIKTASLRWGGVI